ncbi:MAG: PEP-CTERM sorting domain-containing protein [Planctomycetota bacterium]
MTHPDRSPSIADTPHDAAVEAARELAGEPSRYAPAGAAASVEPRSISTRSLPISAMTEPTSRFTNFSQEDFSMTRLRFKTGLKLAALAAAAGLPLAFGAAPASASVLLFDFSASTALPTDPAMDQADLFDGATSAALILPNPVTGGTVTLTFSVAAPGGATLDVNNSNLGIDSSVPSDGPIALDLGEALSITTDSDIELVELDFSGVASDENVIVTFSGAVSGSVLVDDVGSADDFDENEIAELLADVSATVTAGSAAGTTPSVFLPAGTTVTITPAIDPNNTDGVSGLTFPAFTVAFVPEPGSLVLLAAGSALLVSRRRRA